NRMFTCTIMSTIGVVVEDCVDPLHIAHAILGALIGHASLYFTGRILHRDVSTSNDSTSIAVLPPGLTSLHGFLIDLDYAVHIPPGTSVVPLPSSGAPHRTGTLPFMSIGVLRDEPQAYHHDLESFLYVLLRVCLRGEW
ncbi:hypothetical protein DFH27DRAFT_468855, partial [Peziza echinospora]